MDVSRRDRLKVAGGITGGTALGGLAGLGANLAPTLARAQELRIKDARTTPSICPYCSVGCATLVHTVDGRIVNNYSDRVKPDDPNVKTVHGGGIEWTIKDGIPYHVPTLMKEVKDMVTRARAQRVRTTAGQ